MAIVKHVINSTAWTPISTAGQSGSCWLVDSNELTGDRADVRIWHGATAPDNEDDTITQISRRVIRPSDNDDMLLITADSETDIYFARCKESGKTANLIVDVV